MLLLLSRYGYTSVDFISVGPTCLLESFTVVCLLPMQLALFTLLRFDWQLLPMSRITCHPGLLAGSLNIFEHGQLVCPGSLNIP